MRITRIETIPVNVPIEPSRAIQGGRGGHFESPFLFVKIHTDDGLIGLGEVSATPIWSGEDHVTATHFIRDFFEPLMIGQDPGQIDALMRKVSKCVAGQPFTKAALEMALWDLLGKAAGLPLYQLLGGSVRDHVPTKFSISGVAPDRAAEIAAWAVGIGFSTMKVKVGIDVPGDIARVRAVREAIGPDVRLGVDANGGWSQREAVTAIRAMEQFDIYFAEQPVAPGDAAWLAAVRANVNVPIMADESVSNAQEAIMLAQAGAADILSVYIGKGGGIGPARKTAIVAEAAGLACTVGSNLEMSVASAAMIHLAIATSGIDAEVFPCDILGPFFYETDLLAESLPITAGSARPSDKPGLGVDLDPDKIAHYRVD